MRAILVHATLPLADLNLGVGGQWDNTGAAATLLLTTCMTDIVFGELGHMAICMGKMNSSSCSQHFCK
jgi:hypothetical protein